MAVMMPSRTSAHRLGREIELEDSTAIFILSDRGILGWVKFVHHLAFLLRVSSSNMVSMSLFIVTLRL